MPVVESLASLILKKAGALVYVAARDRMQAHQDEKAQRALLDLLDAAAVITGTDPEHATARIAELLEEARPETEAALFEHFRAHMEALEPAAQPYIARMTALYLTERRARDTLFRCVGRMLVDATATEVDQSHAMFAAVRQAVGSQGLAAGEVVRIQVLKNQLDARGRAPHVAVIFGREVLRESGPELPSIDEGAAALIRHRVVPGYTDGRYIDIDPIMHDKLERLMRVFA